MKNFVQTGHVVTVPSAPYNAASGAGLLQGSLFGVCQTTAVSGSPVEIAVYGVYDLPKVGSQAWTVGVRIYWDDATKLCTTAAAGGANKHIGVAMVAVGSGAGETTGRVLLSASWTL